MSSKGRPFAQYFTKLVEIARKTNIDQVEALRTKLRAIKPSDFPGEDINALWIHTTPLVSELIACNGFDHSLTKGLVMMLLTAGGNGAEINLFKHELTRFHALHQVVLDEVSHKSPKEQLEYMTVNELMPNNLFELASTSYNQLVQAGKWPPANNSARVPGGAPQPFANAVPTQGTHVQAFANALLQVMNKGPNVPNPHKNACHNCGSTDHFKRDCPKLKGGSGGGGGSNNRKPGTGNGNRKSQRNNPGRRQELAWKTKPPGPNEPTEKTDNNRKFYWCATCSRWTTSHSTATHIRKGEGGGKGHGGGGPSANLVPTFGNFAWCAPAISIHDFAREAPTSKPRPSSSPSPTPPPLGSSFSQLFSWLSLCIGYLLAALSNTVNFAWWNTAVQSGLIWIVANWTVLLPVLLFFYGLLTLGVYIP